MAVAPIFPQVKIEEGIYESFYLRTVSPDEPVGAWIRYTLHKRPDHAPKGSLWCTVFDASAGAPFVQKHTTSELSVPTGGWISIGPHSTFGEQLAEGHIAISDSEAPSALGEDGAREVRWSLRFDSKEPELRHLKQRWLYKAPLPRTKLTSPAPAASFDGTIELPDRTLHLDGWRGMVGHNWGSEHAERWIWLHGIGFEEDSSAWLDVALGRVLVAGRLTPWIASGAISLDGRRMRLGGLGARGLRVAESAARCSLTIPGEAGLTVEAHVDTPQGASAGWRYGDPDGGEHDVVNCSVAALSLNVRPRTLKGRPSGAHPKGHGQASGEAARTLHTAHGAAYELGMHERDHGVPLAPFSDG
jgi:hypothetical protein